MAKRKEEGLTTYYVERSNGKHQKVTVPSAWKVTFGPLVPGKNYTGQGNNAPALRFWESANKQRMVITDVVSFRDVNIIIEEKRETVKQQRMTKHEDGGAKDVIVEARVHEWVNPDRPERGKQEYMRAIEQDSDF